MPALLLTKDLLFSSSIVAEAKARGLAVQVVLDPATLEDKIAQLGAEVVVLDLASLGAEPAEIVARLRACPQPPRAIVAFGPHVHEQRLLAARDAGCDPVLTRGQFHARGVELLAGLLGPS